LLYHLLKDKQEVEEDALEAKNDTKTNVLSSVIVIIYFSFCNRIFRQYFA
jgi:hypothetical protein